MYTSVCGEDFYWLRSFNAESNESAVGETIKENVLVGSWALVGRPLEGRALMGRALMGRASWDGPLWASSALMGRALMGRALVGRALMGIHGPGPHGPGPCGPGHHGPPGPLSFIFPPKRWSKVINVSSTYIP